MDTKNWQLLNRVINGDCLEVMKQIESNSVDLTVTSPPYDNLRNYNGYSFDFESVAKELYRVTKDGGVVVWVVGDATVKGSETGNSFRQALGFMATGFNLHDTMIYQKANAMPLKSNRYNPCFEYMFVLSKGRPATFNALKEPSKHGGKPSAGTYRHDAKGVLEKCHTPGKVAAEKTRSSIWSYLVRSRAGNDKLASKHPAIFPEQLAADHILSWSNPGETVLDPFGGSGTTAKMALLNGRNFISIDCSEEYCEIARQRIETAKQSKLNLE